MWYRQKNWQIMWKELKIDPKFEANTHRMEQELKPKNTTQWNMSKKHIYWKQGWKMW